MDNGRWQRVWRGVYVTHSGPVDDLTRVWAAVLLCGEGALAGGRTALWLFRAQSGPDPLEICVPRPRQRSPAPGIVVHRVRLLHRRGEYGMSPPRLRIEHAVLDVTDRETHPEPVGDLVLRVLQRRLTTADRVRAVLAQRVRHRWRALILNLLAETEEGVQSPLELRYLRGVERAHGLPRGERNHLEVDRTGRRRYRDIRYRSERLVVELDGREAHPVSEAFRDLRRDNAVVVEGEAVLRYGWRDVTGNPCLVAAQVAGVLTARGWNGSLRRCGPACRLKG